MRILIHGQQAFGKAVLERLMAGPDEVVGVLCLPDREGSPPDPLKEAGLERGLPVHQPETFKTDEALDLVRSFRSDLCVMAYVTLLVPQRVPDAKVDWSRPAEEVHRLICGTDPQPGAWTTVGGNRLKLYGSRLGTGSTSKS